MQETVDNAIVIQLLRGNVASGGAVVNMPRKEFTLLAILVTMREPVEAATLIGRLWPTSPPSDATIALEAHVVRLRRRFARNDLILTNGRTFSLAADVRSDIDEIEACLANRTASPADSSRECNDIARATAGRLHDGLPLFLYDYSVGRALQPRIDTIIEALGEVG
jgi:DNA-binding SARP family transcriptional activator